MPAVRHPAPNFKAIAVISGAFQEVSLNTYTSQGKWVILLFYPLDFTFVCPTEILAFNDSLSEFEDLGAVVLGISTDSEYAHLAWSLQPRKQGGLGPDLKLPLVADKPMRISRDYGVLIEEDGKALRGLFIIDPAGILRQGQQTVNDLPVGRSVDETLRLLKAFQFADKYGEVCPANWKEGGKTMKADPLASMQYFEYIANNGAVEANGKKRSGGEIQVDGGKKART